MPKSALVAASMAYETAKLTHYNDHFFVLKRSTSTPDVPFGKRFIAHTQIVVVNSGKNSCKMICSVEAEFPEGAPMGMGGSIKNGMKSGTIEVFEKMASTLRSCGLSS